MNEFFEWRDAPIAEFGVIGSPIHHSLSPRMHKAAFEALGLKADYVALHVPSGEVHSALDHFQSLGYRGINVTVPHKEEAFTWCHSHSPIAEDLGVCNTLELATQTGHNTDVLGIQACLSQLGVTEGRALVLGAGGSGRAAVYALSKAGLNVALWNRTQSRAEELIDALGLPVEMTALPDVAGFDLILNTTSVSLNGGDLPIDWSRAPDGCAAFDLAYRDGLTDFLLGAQAAGLKVLDGRRMLMEQGASAFEIWWQEQAPREAMLEAIS